MFIDEKLRVYLLGDGMGENDSNKWVCMAAYIIFFMPLIVDHKNRSYRFHASQGLILLILALITGIIGVFIPVIGWFIIVPVGGFVCLILMVIGIINAYNNKMKELPIIGKYRLIR